VIKFVEAVRSHPILWDSRHDDYKLAERKPIVSQRSVNVIDVMVL